MKRILLAFFAVLFIAGYAQADNYYFTQEFSTTVLDGDEAYSSSCMRVENYKTVNLNVLADQDSAAAGVDINFYNDSSCSVLLYSANLGGWSYNAGSLPESYSAAVRGDFAKVVFTNGATPQASFKINIFLTK